MKIFISYTAKDRGWAHWIGWHLRDVGHEPFVHEWEIGAGENIPRWMEERAEEADRILGLFSDEYTKALYSQSERWAAYWQDPGGRKGFLVPIEIEKVTKWPAFVEPLRRLSLVGLGEIEALKHLLTFLENPKPPSEKPLFPGLETALSPSKKFIAGGENLGSIPPNFPVPSLVSGQQADERQTHWISLNADDSVRCIDDYLPRPAIFGRESEIAKCVEALLAGNTAIVAGGPGMGKTSVAVASLRDPRIEAQFGRRRVFASLEAATEPRAIITKLVEALGVPPVGDEISLLHILEANAERPLVAIIDNAETVFDSDSTEAVRLLSLVSQVKGLSLAVTIRGVAPPIPAALRIDDLPRLDTRSARDAFLAVAGLSFQNDENLPHLLDALDGHALSIQLIAAQAIGLPSLQGLRESWDEAHAAILRKSGEEEGRLTSVRASLALSLESRRMGSVPLARRLMALLAFLPIGLDESDARLLLGEPGALTKTKANEAVSCLHQLRLVELRTDRRLRMLTPLRECVKSDVHPLEADKRRMVDRFMTIAAKARTIGTDEWEKSREAVEKEADNLDSICDLVVSTSIAHKRLENAIFGLKELHKFSGLATIGSISHARRLLRGRPPSRLAAICARALGDVASIRADYEVALSLFNESLSIYRAIGDLRGQAHSIDSIGDVAFRRSDYALAKERYAEALALYRRERNTHGEANVLHQLGHIAVSNSDHKLANIYYEDALVRYRRIGGVLGEANNMQSLANIATMQLNLKAAQTLSESALKLHRRIGNLMGEASHVFNLAEIAFFDSRHEDAFIGYQEALTRFRRLGAVSPEAGCIARLGAVAFASSDFETARTRFNEALGLRRQAGDGLGEAEMRIKLGLARRRSGDSKNAAQDIEAGFDLYFEVSGPEDLARTGWEAIRLMLTSADPREMRDAREAARSAWLAIGRADLVYEWVGPH